MPVSWKLEVPFEYGVDALLAEMKVPIERQVMSELNRLNERATVRSSCLTAVSVNLVRD